MALIVKSKLAKSFTKIHHATSTYYNIPKGYEHTLIKKGAEKMALMNHGTSEH